MAPDDGGRRHRESGTRRHHKKRSSGSRNQSSTEGTSGRASQSLSVDALARLNEANSRNTTAADRIRDAERAEAAAREKERERRRRREARQSRERRHEYRGVEVIEEVERPRRHSRHHDRDDRHERHDRRERRGRRQVSGAVMEEGRSRGHTRGGIRGGWGSWESSNDSMEREKDELYERSRPKRKKRLWIIGGIAIVLIIVIIVVAVVVSQKNAAAGGDTKEQNLSGVSKDSIPAGAPAWLDPFQWTDTKDFNLTYTAQAVGDLPVMGLKTDWDDSKAANEKVPALSQPWGDYAKRPARGVNVGGWLSLEPFITPSLFQYDPKLGIVDEGTLCQYLGARCNSVLERHYASFVTEQTFADIAAAGLDHVRIPYSYWAVQTYDGDNFLYRTSWRYLLRAIEWCRKYGLRVKLDLHGIPGSQNGWNHSGRLGAIGWMNGTNGDTNVKRSLEVHDRLSKFFAQDRYKNIISHYGLANEPRMTFLPVSSVMSWTQEAAAMVRKNGMNNSIIVFGDGFMGLDKWKGQPNTHNMALDVHQYLIFNNEQIKLTHAEKIKFACQDWSSQTVRSMDTSTGFGPTLMAEWSQADTDCATWLGNVGNGNRWTGTYNVGNATLNALTPMCPTKNSQCSCDGANADPTKYSASYKQWLLMFAEAQMYSYEKGWGWFYWTWDTETAAQWSYKKGLAAGILPKKAYEPSFKCDLSQIPSFSDLPETY